MSVCGRSVNGLKVAATWLSKCKSAKCLVLHFSFFCLNIAFLSFVCLHSSASMLFAEVFSHSLADIPKWISPVTIETFSQSLASAHTLAMPELHTTLSARLSQPQPEGGALAAVMLWLNSGEFSEKYIPTSRWVAEMRRDECGDYELLVLHTLI